MLALAHLDRARGTHAAADLAAARAAAAESLKIQPSFQAYQAMAAICGFAHRFEETLTWCDRAESASPSDTSVLGQRVEALVELGRIDEAEQRLRLFAAVQDDFYVWVSRGRCLVAREQAPAAADAFRNAAKIARARDAAALAAWAGAMAAGCFIDIGDADRAQAILDDAEMCDPSFAIVQLHRAEWLELRGRHAESLTILEKLLARNDDPVLRARACLTAHAAGESAAARRHFERAEAGCRAIMDAGEVFTLGTLAELYARNGVKLAEARSLARRNLEIHPDARSRRLVDEIELLLAPASRAAETP